MTLTTFVPRDVRGAVLVAVTKARRSIIKRRGGPQKVAPVSAD